MKRGSEADPADVALEGPVYLDTSALAKLYLPEPESAWVDDLLRGRTDVCVSDLTLTELASALGRRTREGSVTLDTAARCYRRAVSDVERELFLHVELTPEVHREAERLLLGAGLVPLRSLDALHVALATGCGAHSLVTFDGTLARAASACGLLVAPLPPVPGPQSRR